MIYMYIYIYRDRVNNNTPIGYTLYLYIIQIILFYIIC